MRIVFLATAILISNVYAHSQNAVEILSPDGKIKVAIQANSGLSFGVIYDNNIVLKPSQINFVLNNGHSLSGNLSLKKLSRRSINSVIVSAVPEKRLHIPDHFNELTIRFRQPMSVVFRVYNDGLAYRFLTHINDSIIVQEETARFSFPGNPTVVFSEVMKRENTDIYHTSFEEPYVQKSIDSITSNNYCFTPTLISPDSGPKNNRYRIRS